MALGTLHQRPLVSPGQRRVQVSLPIRAGPLRPISVAQQQLLGSRTSLLCRSAARRAAGSEGSGDASGAASSSPSQQPSSTVGSVEQEGQFVRLLRTGAKALGAVAVLVVAAMSGLARPAYAQARYAAGTGTPAG